MKNYLKTGILLLGILISTTNCEKEDLISIQTPQQTSQKQNQTITSFQNNFTLDNFKDDFVRNNLIVKWNEFIIIKKPDSSISYEFLTNLNATVSFNDSKNNLNIKYKLNVTISENKVIDIEIVKFLGKNKNLLKDIGLEYLNGFKGAIYHFNLNGDLIKLESFDKGKIVNTFEYKFTSSDKAVQRAPVLEGWVPLITINYTDWYFNLGTSYYYFKSHITSTTIEYVYVGSNSGNYNPDDVAHAHYPHTAPVVPIDTHLEEIIIDSTFANTKAECIFNKLGNSSTGFKNAIKKFDGEFPVAHLKMSVDNNLPDTINATTSNSGTYTIEIKINGNTLPNRTVMGLARTMIHETIHAEMYRKLRSVNYSVSINDFPGIFYYYSTYKNWQHQQMASHYRTTIVDMLKEFDNNQHTDSFYNDLAWEGLQGTVSWNELSSNEKTRIINAINNYKNNGNKNCI